MCIIISGHRKKFLVYHIRKLTKVNILQYNVDCFISILLSIYLNNLHFVFILLLGNSTLYHHHNDHVIFNLRPVLMCLLLEMEYSIGRFPIMKMETVLTITVDDWHNNFHLESNIKFHAFCYNKTYQNWEPFIELCTKDDVNYKPWEFMIKVAKIIDFIIHLFIFILLFFNYLLI